MRFEESVPNARRAVTRRTRLIFFTLLILACTVSACKSSLFSRREPSDSAKASAKKRSKNGKGEVDGSSASKVIGRLEDPSVDESSGLASSRRNPGVLWTHNDSGDDPFIFAFDMDGKRRGVWRVEGAKARDWEDIAVGPGPESGRSYIYIGDIGNNKYSREQIIIYRVPEPAVEAEDRASTRKSPRRTEAAEAIRVRYPEGVHDAEALMVHPLTGDIYIATKTTDAACTIYKLDAQAATSTSTSNASGSASNVLTLARLGTVRIPSPFGAMITGGSISPDGRRVVLCDYLRAYELRPADDSTSAFDEVWRQAVVSLALGPRNQGEAVCYRPDGAAILATSEGRYAPIIELELARPAQSE